MLIGNLESWGKTEEKEMGMKTKEMMKKMVRLLLVGVIVAAVLCIVFPQAAGRVQAEETYKKSEANTKFGLGDIQNPQGIGGWSYVYFGTCAIDADTNPGWSNTVYRGPTRYRVLDMNSTDFGVEGGSLLLDCDWIIYWCYYDNKCTKQDFYNHNIWNNSTVRAWLNDSFYNDYFSDIEKNAIAVSSKASKVSGDGTCPSYYSFTPVENDRIFILDAVEAARESYGYDNSVSGYSYANTSSDARVKRMYNYYGKNDERSKYPGGYTLSWWIRSPSSRYGGYQGRISSNGSFSDDSPKDFSDWNTFGNGVCPALNIYPSSVFMTTLVSGNAGEAGAQYKLTMKDPSLTVSVGSTGLSRTGNTVYVPYTSTGSPNRISVLITNKAYNTSGAAIKYYDALEIISETEGTGLGAFTLPSDYIPSTDKIYIMPENANNEKNSWGTDYAGTPVEITSLIPKNVTPECTVTFDPNGEAATVEPAELKTGTSGKLTASALPVPQNKGYEFKGWYSTKTGGEEITTDTVFYTDSVVFAHWEKGTYTVYFEPNGDGATVDP